MVSIFPLISDSYRYFFFKTFRNHSKCANYNWYHYHPHVSQFFLVLWQGPSICLSFCILLFLLCCPPEWQIPLDNNINITPCGFFTPALVDGLSLEPEWQQVSSSLHKSFLYFSQPQQCCSLDGLSLFSDFQLSQLPYHDFGDCSKCTNYNWYHHHLHVL